MSTSAAAGAAAAALAAHAAAASGAIGRSQKPNTPTLTPTKDESRVLGLSILDGRQQAGEAYAKLLLDY